MGSRYNIVAVATLNARRTSLAHIPTPEEHEAAGARVEFEIWYDGERTGRVCDTAAEARALIKALEERDERLDSEGDESDW